MIYNMRGTVVSVSDERTYGKFRKRDLVIKPDEVKSKDISFIFSYQYGDQIKDLKINEMVDVPFSITCTIDGTKTYTSLYGLGATVVNKSVPTETIDTEDDISF